MNPQVLYTQLLGIPPDIEKPTKYELLGLPEQGITPKRVEKALEERRLRARQNVPDARLIPAVLMVEKELQEAAETLKDPKKRAVYDAELARERGVRPKPDIEARKAELRKYIREQAKRLGEPDGSMTAANKEELARLFADRQIPAKTIDHILGQIADHVTEPEPVAPEPPEAPAAPQDEASPVRFLEEAIKMVVSKGAISAKDRNGFVEMGRHIGLSEQQVLELIERVAKPPEAPTPVPSEPPAEAPVPPPIEDAPSAPPEAAAPPESLPEPEPVAPEAKQELVPEVKPEPKEGPAAEPERAPEPEPKAAPKPTADSALTREGRKRIFAERLVEICPSGRPSTDAEKDAVSGLLKEIRVHRDDAREVIKEIRTRKAETGQPKAEGEAGPVRAPRKRRRRHTGWRALLRWESLIPTIVLIVFLIFVWLISRSQ